MMVDGLEHLFTLKNVLFAPDIMQNLLCISEARKCGFQVRIDEDQEHSTRGRMGVIHKGSGVGEMYKLETLEILHEGAARVRWE